MRLAIRVVLVHLATCLALWLISYQGDHLACCGIRFVASYVATFAFYVINTPGIPVAQALVLSSIDHTLGQPLATNSIMILSTEAVLALIVISGQRVMRRAA